jgi:hypothetical protein
VADLAPVAHHAILRAIREAQEDVEGLRKGTKLRTGYKGFNLVKKTLADCHEAIVGERDHAGVVAILTSAAVDLTLIDDGDVAPAVGRTNKMLRGLLQTLGVLNPQNP